MEDKRSKLLQLHFLKEKFFFLLISLLFLCFFYTLVPAGVSRFLTLDITFLFILFTGIYAVIEKKAVFIIALILALTGFGARVFNYFLMSASLQLLGLCIYLMFFILMAVVILVHITKSTKVTAYTIYGALCVYLLMGIVWAELFAIVEMFEPGSFLSGGEPIVKVAGEFQRRPGFENLL